MNLPYITSYERVCQEHSQKNFTEKQEPLTIQIYTDIRVVVKVGDILTKEEMIQQLLDEFERNCITLESDNPKKILERRQLFIKAQLETFGVNTEPLENK